MPAIFRGWTGQNDDHSFSKWCAGLCGIQCDSRGFPGPQIRAAANVGLAPCCQDCGTGSPDWVGIGDSVWISNNPKNNVSKIDTQTNKIIATISVGKAPCAGLAIGFRSVWIPNCGDGSVWRLDPLSQKRVASIATGVADTEGGITAGEGSIWIPSDATGILA